jgi:threonylcarbamoyladenosine tRNA methylthiotransferase MtaB
MKRISLYTLGCKLNYAETAGLERQFVDRGFTIVPFESQSDVCIVNTCSVTDRADRECRQIVRRALRTSPDAFIVVTGCYAQLEPEEIASIDGVDLVLGAAEKFHLFDFAGEFEKYNSPRIHVSSISEVNEFGAAYSGGADGRTRAFLKIQDGCDFNCSFCTIPLARGKSRSLSIDECENQARYLATLGYQEVVLTGVNVGDYGKNDGNSLLHLLQRLERVEGLHRIRVSSIEPNLLHPSLLEFWLDSEKICNHFHLPLQSGNDAILRGMRRRYSSSFYRKLILSIKEKDPDTGIGVDVIVGFPGETENIFESEYSFLNDLPVSYLHVFTYSERPDTPSIKFGSRVEPRIRYKRSEMLRILGQKKKHAFYFSQIGRTLPVLMENRVDGNMMSGYTPNYVRVQIPHHPSLENTIVPVQLIGIAGEECTGKIEEDIPLQPATLIPVLDNRTDWAERPAPIHY